MLRIDMPEKETYDSANNEFRTYKSMNLLLEHSLIAVSKWEMKWKKPFVNNADRLTDEEFLDYVRCMIIGNDSIDLGRLGVAELNKIKEYMNDPMTATTFAESDKKSTGQIITNEEIYSWMADLHIPFTCEKWHLNRLLTLIQVCNLNHQEPKKMSRKDTMAMYRRINAERRAKMKSKG